MSGFLYKPTKAQRDIITRALTIKDELVDVQKPFGRIDYPGLPSTMRIMRLRGWVEQNFTIQDANARTGLEAELVRHVNEAKLILNKNKFEDWDVALAELSDAKVIRDQLAERRWWVTDAAKAAVK